MRRCEYCGSGSVGLSRICGRCGAIARNVANEKVTVRIPFVAYAWLLKGMEHERSYPHRPQGNSEYIEIQQLHTIYRIEPIV